MADIRQVWQKIDAGQQLDEEEKATLRVMIQGLAPSDPAFQKASAALGPPNPYIPSSESSQSPELGWPTLDWLGGLTGQYAMDDREGALPNRRTKPYSFPNETAPPTTPDEGPDTIQDPRGHNRELIEERADAEGFPAWLQPPPSTFGASPVGVPLDDLDLPDIEPLPGGYSFSEMRPGDIANAYNNPQLMMRLIASDAGQGPASEAMMMPYLQSARALAGMGVLGGTGSMDFEGVQDDPIGSFRMVEEFMDTMNQPGMQFMDQSQLRQGILDRATGQDWSTLTDQYGQPWGHEQIIETTNQAMLAASPFMTNEAAGMLASKLNAAALNYMHLVATGDMDPDTSYPEYLREIGADTWFA